MQEAHQAISPGGSRNPRVPCQIGKNICYLYKVMSTRVSGHPRCAKWVRNILLPKKYAAVDPTTPPELGDRAILRSRGSSPPKKWLKKWTNNYKNHEKYQKSWSFSSFFASYTCRTVFILSQNAPHTFPTDSESMNLIRAIFLVKNHGFQPKTLSKSTNFRNSLYPLCK